MNRFSFVLPLALSFFALSTVGCGPATTYNRGIDMSFHPSAKADAGEKLVDSAVEIRTDDEERALRQAGAVYLGELEVTGKRAGAAFTGAGEGAGTLSGRVSLEAATRGATHFHAVSSSSTSSIEPAGRSFTPTSKMQVRFVLYRLEPGAWTQIAPALRPTTPTPAAMPPAPPSVANR